MTRAAPAFAQDEKALSRPEGKSADHPRNVKAFILLGQSKLLGIGRVGPKDTKGSLAYTNKDEG